MTFHRKFFFFFSFPRIVDDETGHASLELTLLQLLARTNYEILIGLALANFHGLVTFASQSEAARNFGFTRLPTELHRISSFNTLRVKATNAVTRRDHSFTLLLCSAAFTASPRYVDTFCRETRNLWCQSSDRCYLKYESGR